MPRELSRLSAEGERVAKRQKQQQQQQQQQQQHEGVGEEAEGTAQCLRPGLLQDWGL